MSKYAQEFSEQQVSTGKMKGITKIKQAEANISKILKRDAENFRRKKVKADIQKLLGRDHY